MSTKEIVIPLNKNWLGAYLRKLRLAAGRTHKQIADHLGMNRVQITTIESGDRYIRDKEIIKNWVKFLGGGVDEIRTAWKYALVTYPQMFVSTHRLSADDRLRLLAIIQELHGHGMTNELRDYANKIIEKGTVVRAKDQGTTNIPDEDKKHSSNQFKKTSYEDYSIDPDLNVDDAGFGGTDKFAFLGI
jgi:transcriptional regulator with XRE-family HTH domain